MYNSPVKQRLLSPLYLSRTQTIAFSDDGQFSKTRSGAIHSVLTLDAHDSTKNFHSLVEFCICAVIEDFRQKINA